MAGENKTEVLTLENLETALAKDKCVKLAGVDIDGKHTFNMSPSPS